MKHILILNRWRTPDGTILESKNRHDFVKHVDENGDTYFIDGGTDYIRMSVNDEKMENLCVFADDDFETVRRNEFRGTFDDLKMKWIPLYKLSDKHVVNCIIYNLRHCGKKLNEYNVHTHLYVKEMLYRLEKNICLDEYNYTDEAISKEPEYKEVSLKNTSPEDIDRSYLLNEILEILANEKTEVHTMVVYFALRHLDLMFDEIAERVCFIDWPNENENK